MGHPNYKLPYTKVSRGMTRSLLDLSGVSHVETTSNVRKFVVWPMFLLWKMHDFYRASLLKKHGKQLFESSYLTHLPHQLVVKLSKRTWLGIYHNLQQSSTIRMITWLTTMWLIHPIPQNIYIGWKEKLLRNEGCKFFRKKMFETWNQHLELDESVWDDVSPKKSSQTKGFRGHFGEGPLAPNPPMKQLKYWNYWCSKNCIAPSLGGGCWAIILHLVGASSPHTP